MVYNETLEREECRFCGLPDNHTRDNHERSCPEMPMTDDVENLKTWARHNDYIVVEDSQ